MVRRRETRGQRLRARLAHSSVLYVLIPAATILFTYFLPAHHLGSSDGWITIITFIIMLYMMLSSSRPPADIKFTLQCSFPHAPNNPLLTELISAPRESSLLELVASVTGIPIYIVSSCRLHAVSFCIVFEIHFH